MVGKALADDLLTLVDSPMDTVMVIEGSPRELTVLPTEKEKNRNTFHLTITFPF